MKKPNKYQIIDFIEDIIRHEEGILREIKPKFSGSYGVAIHEGKLDQAKEILNFINTGEYCND